MEKEIKKELSCEDGEEMNDLPTEQEMEFLQYIPHYTWTKEEIYQLNKKTSSEEVINILENEVDLDSAPGEDGITYRIIKRFMKNKNFREIYIDYLNYTREIGGCGSNISNTGVMVVKNKKSQSIEYEKKRKLTKLNKDTNLGNGKVWTNRMKDIILPKILPKTQFNCQKDINIIDEIVELRDINIDLLQGNGGQEKDATILSIDFSNAFRSTSLRWYNLVMKKLNIPQEFIDWFWSMYNNSNVRIKINDGEAVFVRSSSVRPSPLTLFVYNSGSG